LRRRAVPASAIACVTFNRAAKKELSERLEAGGVGDVRALTFHGLG
jgi:superfamily I DNA/RNA helicase